MDMMSDDDPVLVMLYLGGAKKPRWYVAKRAWLDRQNDRTRGDLVFDSVPDHAVIEYLISLGDVDPRTVIPPNETGPQRHRRARHTQQEAHKQRNKVDNKEMRDIMMSICQRIAVTPETRYRDRYDDLVREPIPDGDTLVRLPCGHGYSERNLLAWWRIEQERCNQWGSTEGVKLKCMDGCAQSVMVCNSLTHPPPGLHIIHNPFNNQHTRGTRRRRPPLPHPHTRVLSTHLEWLFGISNEKSK